MIRTTLTKGWQPVLAILTVLLIWEVSVRQLAIEEWLLPAPTAIVEEAGRIWSQFIPHLQSTIFLAICGFLIGTTVGLVVATVLHLCKPIRDTFYPFLILSQNIPIIVLAPLLVIWFGFGSLPKFIVITIACFFPIAVSALSGFRQSNRDTYHYLSMMGATKKQLFLKMELPSAIPSIMSGVKIAATYSVMAAVISEWLGAQKGIGVFMTVAVSSYKTSRVFVAIIVTMALSLLFFAVIVLIEKYLVRWKQKGDRS